MVIKIGTAVLDDCEESTIQELFSLVGTRADGSVSLHEVAEVLTLLGLVSDRELLAKSRGERQTDQSSLRSIGDALQVLLPGKAGSYTQHNMLNDFTLFADTEGSGGHIAQKALKTALAKHCSKQLTCSDVDKLLAEVASPSQTSIDCQDIISSFFCK